MKMTGTYQQQKWINVDKDVVPNLKHSSLKLQREYNSAATTHDKVYHVGPDYGGSRKKACGVDKVFPLKPVHHKRAYSLIKIPLGNNHTKMLEPLETAKLPPISPLLPSDCPRMSKEKVSNRFSGQRFQRDQLTLPPIHRSLAKASMWAKGGTGEASLWESEGGGKEGEEQKSWLMKDIHRREIDLQEKLQRTQETLKRIWKEREISAKKRADMRPESEKEKAQGLMERDGSDYKKAAKYDRQDSERMETEMERKEREYSDWKLGEKLKEEQLERQKRVMEAELKNERIVMEQQWERERERMEEHESERGERREQTRMTQREEWERKERGKKVEWEIEMANRGNGSTKMREFQKDRMGREGETDCEKTQPKCSQVRRQEALQERDDGQCHSPWKATEDSPMSPVHLAEESLSLANVAPSNMEWDMEETKLLPCNLCHRNILAGRLENHERVCKRRQESKPKLFDSFKQRAKGTALEEFVKHNEGSNKTSVIKRSPRQEKQKIVRKLQEGHLPRDSSRQPQSTPDTSANYVACPHCRRWFDPRTAERHISKCQFNKNLTPACRRRL